MIVMYIFLAFRFCLTYINCLRVIYSPSTHYRLSLQQIQAVQGPIVRFVWQSFSI